jgi:DNA modification methylase
VAAKMTGRTYIGIDLSEEYCEIAQQRIDLTEEIVIAEIES